jgi:hypothetical protein
MNVHLKRPYRKALNLQGLIYLGGEEQEVTVKNLSVSGVQTILNNQWDKGDIKELFSTLSTSSTLIDFYFPELRLAGEAEVVRADTDEHNKILLSLEFKHIAYDIDNLLYKRKAYRKTMAVPGRIAFDSKFYDFVSVNISVDGIMIKLNETIEIDEGTITLFEFKAMDLNGSVKVIWTEKLPEGGILMGMQYVNLSKAEITGIPRFFS